MKYATYCMGAALMTAFVGAAMATPTAEEAAQLGKTLTPMGSIKAGNADGSIPAWDGGICTPPAGYKPYNPAGGFPYIDPYAHEKPLYSITGANMDKYATELDEGVKVLLKRYPNFRVDVYPSHRTACFPEYVYENTIKRVMNPRLVAGGVGLDNAHAQIPFPIPKNGFEVMWNSNVKYTYPFIRGTMLTVLTDTSGHATELNLMDNSEYTPYWDTNRKPVQPDEAYWTIKSNNVWPPAEAGVGSLLVFMMRPDLHDNYAYSYIPGQRRVRLAPEFKYDGVATNSGGILLWDEVNCFFGAMDKFDFKLIGRKEMIVPYNVYQQEMASVAKLNTKDFANPDVVRWEKHRVWVVQADLKPGQRHVEKQKVFYVDEDSWNILTYYGVDQAGKPYHYMQEAMWQEYDKPSPWNGNYILYDLNRGIWSSGSQQGNPDHKATGFYKVKPFPPGFLAPEALAGSGVR